MDGCWKISRSKCVFDQISFKSEQFGKIRTGCRNTSCLNSYFCKAQGKDLIFNSGNGKKICFNSARIKTSNLGKY